MIAMPTPTDDGPDEGNEHESTYTDDWDSLFDDVELGSDIEVSITAYVAAKADDVAEPGILIQAATHRGDQTYDFIDLDYLRYEPGWGTDLEGDYDYDAIEAALVSRGYMVKPNTGWHASGGQTSAQLVPTYEV